MSERDLPYDESYEQSIEAYAAAKACVEAVCALAGHASYVMIHVAASHGTVDVKYNRKRLSRLHAQLSEAVEFKPVNLSEVLRMIEHTVPAGDRVSVCGHEYSTAHEAAFGLANRAKADVEALLHKLGKTTDRKRASKLLRKEVRKLQVRYDRPEGLRKQLKGEYEGQRPSQPQSDPFQRLMVDLQHNTVMLDGTPYRGLTPEATAMIHHLKERRGDWVGKKEMRGRDDGHLCVGEPKRVRCQLPAELQEIIEARRGRGHRLNL